MQIFVRDLALDARVGALDGEVGRVQPLLIDIEAVVEPPVDDRIEDACDYRELARRATDIVSGGHIVLIETVAERIARSCLTQNGVRAVKVMVRKPQALAPALAGVVVEYAREGSI